MRQLFQEDNNNKYDSNTGNTDEATKKWESLWKQNCTPWDLGKPTKVLLSELENKSPRRPYNTALIPGCGSGYDVISLARYWDTKEESSSSSSSLSSSSTVIHQHQISSPSVQRIVVGLEVSKTSLERATDLLKQSIEDDGPFQTTKIKLYLGDFFADPSTWKLYLEETSTLECSKNSYLDKKHHSLNIDDDGVSSSTTNNAPVANFDFIFDYTFFCAIPPNKRRQWGQQMIRLLQPSNVDIMDQIEDTEKQESPCSGELLTLMFPYVSSPRYDSPGPPYLISSQDYIDAFQETTKSSEQTLTLEQPPYESKDTVSSRKGQEYVAWWSFCQEK
jgi:hypothetical protein